MSEDESKKRLVNNIFDGDCAVERGASAASHVVFSRNFQLHGDERSVLCGEERQRRRRETFAAVTNAQESNPKTKQLLQSTDAKKNH